MNETTKFVRNTLNYAMFSCYVKRTRGTNGNAAKINAGFFARRNDCFNNIASLKAIDNFFCFRRSSRESIFVNPAKLSGAAACGMNQQRMKLRKNFNFFASLSYTSRVYPVVFSICLFNAIVFGLAPL